MNNMVWGEIIMAAIFALAFGYVAFIKTKDRKLAHNSTYPKVAVQWLNQALSFY